MQSSTTRPSARELRAAGPRLTVGSGAGRPRRGGERPRPRRGRPAPGSRCRRCRRAGGGRSGSPAGTSRAARGRRRISSRRRRHGRPPRAPGRDRPGRRAAARWLPAGLRAAGRGAGARSSAQHPDSVQDEAGVGSAQQQNEGKTQPHAKERPTRGRPPVRVAPERGENDDDHGQEDLEEGVDQIDRRSREGRPGGRPPGAARCRARRRAAPRPAGPGAGCATFPRRRGPPPGRSGSAAWRCTPG